MSHSYDWSPSSWREKPIAQVCFHALGQLAFYQTEVSSQDVIYQDKTHLDRVCTKLRHLPPLVSPVEVRRQRSWFYSSVIMRLLR